MAWSITDIDVVARFQGLLSLRMICAASKPYVAGSVDIVDILDKLTRHLETRFNQRVEIWWNRKGKVTWLTSILRSERHVDYHVADDGE